PEVPGLSRPEADPVARGHLAWCDRPVRAAGRRGQPTGRGNPLQRNGPYGKPGRPGRALYLLDPGREWEQPGPLGPGVQRLRQERGVYLDPVSQKLSEDPLPNPPPKGEGNRQGEGGKGRPGGRPLFLALLTFPWVMP